MKAIKSINASFTKNRICIHFPKKLDESIDDLAQQLVKAMTSLTPTSASNNQSTDSKKDTKTPPSTNSFLGFFSTGVSRYIPTRFWSQVSTSVATTQPISQAVLKSERQTIKTNLFVNKATIKQPIKYEGKVVGHFTFDAKDLSKVEKEYQKAFIKNLAENNLLGDGHFIRLNEKKSKSSYDSAVYKMRLFSKVGDQRAYLDPVDSNDKNCKDFKLRFEKHYKI